MALTTAQHYIDIARRLVQDETVPYRYSDVAMIEAINIAILEMNRLRPEMFFGVTIPDISDVADTLTINDPNKIAIAYYITGHVQLSDDEPSQDARGTGFIQKFNAMLTKPGA